MTTEEIVDAPTFPSWVHGAAVDLDVAGLLARLREAPPVTVVVAVHDGGYAVRCGLAALLRHTPVDRLLVLDDASTALATLRLLEEVAGRGVRVVRQEENLGNTRTANLGLELAGTGDVVLLSSDAEVGPTWLQRLRWTAYSTADVATVSAVSDNAGAMSVPVPGRANDWPAHLTWDEVARGAARSVAGEQRTWAVPAPTGHGFCLYVRRAAVDAVGGFDAEAFGVGYGQENDFCMRAGAAGMTNLVAPHVLVRHARSQSSGQERRDALAGRGRETVDRRHPRYTAEVRAWMSGEAMTGMHAEMDGVRRDLGRESEVHPRCLYVVQRAGGDTVATSGDLMAALAVHQDSFLLEADDAVAVRLSHLRGGHPVDLGGWAPAEPFAVTDAWRQDYAEQLARLLIGLDVELVHVRHLINQPLTTLPELCTLLGIPYVLSTHDFYLACPSVHLLDEQVRFCGGRCTPGEGTCQLPTPFVAAVPPLKHRWIRTWQERGERVLAGAEAVVVTTESARAVLAGVYPHLAARLVRIEPGREPLRQRVDPRHDRPRRAGPFRVLAPANWDLHKGRDYLSVIVRATSPEIEWHVMGARSEQVEGAVVHGAYRRDQLPLLLDEVDPDVVGLFSVWPETYSHTLTEAWALGVPVVATDTGTFADQVGARGGGLLVPVDDADAAARTLLDLAREDRGAGLRALGTPTGGTRATVTMAEDYRTLCRRRRGARPPVVGLVARTDGRRPPPTVHIRALRRLLTLEHRERITLRLVSPVDLARGQDATDYDAVVVVRDAVPPEVLEPFVRRASAGRLVVDVDDDMLGPGSRDRLLAGGYSGPRLDDLAVLVSAADLVTTSTEPLAQRLREVNPRVQVWPNVLDERLWFSDAGRMRPRTASRRLLYMGSRTHGADLDLLDGVATAVGDLVGERVVLELVGVSAVDDPRAEHLRTPDSAVHYPEFVRWLRRHRDRWDVALAPLRDDAFNAVKSDLKLLEYAAMRLPVVASDCGPYAGRHDMARLVQDGCEPWAAAVADALGGGQGDAPAARAAHVRRERVVGPTAGAWLEAVLGADG